MATTVNQGQLIAYKRGYYDRGVEIDSLKAKIAELEATIKKLEKANPTKKKEDK